MSDLETRVKNLESVCAGLTIMVILLSIIPALKWLLILLRVVGL